MSDPVSRFTKVDPETGRVPRCDVCGAEAMYDDDGVLHCQQHSSPADTTPDHG